jgi:hypothetical protein
VSFELFVNKNWVYKKPIVSILATGQISLNTFCMRKFFIGHSCVALYFDKSSESIGIKPIIEKQDDFLKISKSSMNKSGSISAIGFMHYFKINIKDHQGKYYPTWEEKENMLIIKLGHKLKG